MTILQNTRFALRRLAHNPGFTLAAVLTLALGLGATSAIFSVIRAALLRPVPYEDPERLVLLTGTQRGEEGTQRWPIAYFDFVDWRSQTTAFESMAAMSDHPESFNLSGTGEPERVSGEMASAGYFELLGIEPVLGRTFSPEEDKLGAGRRVAILGHGLWKRRFGGDREIVGKPLFLNGEKYSIIGVLPEGFKGMNDQSEVWLPLTLTAQVYSADLIEERFIRWLSAVGRLKPEATLAQAQGELDRITADLEKKYPQSNEGYGVQGAPLTEAWFGELRTALLTLFGAAAFVLLIACTNVANLLLAQAARREREIAIRAAMGASRKRLAGQLLTESLVLATLGCVGGLLLARWGTDALVAASAVKLRSFVRIELDPLVVTTIAALAVLCGLLFGMMPAWSASRQDQLTALKEGGRGATSGRRRFQNALVVAEVALALVLLVGAALMVQSFRNLRQTDLGFATDGVLTLRADLKGKQYTKEVQQALTLQYLEKIRSVPGVATVAIAGPTLPGDDWWAMDVVFENRPPEDRPILPYHAVTPDYFKAMGIPLLQGRNFTFDDKGQPPVVVIGKALADRVWPGENPIGKRMKSPGPPGANRPWWTVVGVVGDASHHGLDPKLKRPGPDIYMPLFQLNQTDPIFNFIVRSDGIDPDRLAPSVREAVLAVTPTLPVYDVATLEERIGRQAGGARFLALLMTLFAVLALGLAAVGIYGVISYSVTQRRREIGLRMAVGARRSDVLRLILGQTVTLAVLGVVLGALAAFALRGVVASRLEGVEPANPLMLALAALVLLGVAAMAGLLPARSAARTDPVVTLNDAN